MIGRLVLLLGCLCLVTTPARAAGWKLVFQDQFDGTALDRARWATRYIYGNETLDHLNDEKQRYRDNANHVVGGGSLSLVARPASGGMFESGMIRSRQTFYYGYFEARVFLPKGRGIWPAFWLNSDYDAAGKLGWPPEIDIFEYAVNGIDDTSSMVHSAAPTVPANAAIDYLYTDPKYSRRWRSYVADAPLNEGWHVFGLVWAPDRITVFLDGRRLYTRKYAWLHKDGSAAGPAHVLLNFAVGGSWAGRYGIDQAAFPQALKVDYVRVCQFTAGGGGRRDCGGSPVTPDPAAFGYRTPFDDLPKPLLGAATMRIDPGGRAARVTVPIAAPPGYRGDRLLRVSLFAPAGGAAVAGATVPIAFAGPGRIAPEIQVPLAGPLARYRVLAQLLTAAGTPTPITCAPPNATIKALSCVVGTISASRRDPR